MKILNRPDLTDKSRLIANPTVITMGNFDGCHLGHQTLLKKALQIKEDHKLESLALSFSPRSKVFFKKETDSDELFTNEQKSRAFAELGFDHHIIEAFNEHLCQTTHEIYYKNRLKQNLNMKGVVIGEDFCFGAQRKGTSQWLQTVTEKEGGLCSVVSRQTLEQASLSQIPLRSSSIRSLLKEGKVDLASKFLGRPYMLEGIVREGLRLGRSLETPTLNLLDLQQLLPKYGVYAGWIWLEERASPFPRILATKPSNLLPAVFNIGLRPTLQNQSKTPVTEGHILNHKFPENAFYGKRAGFYLTHKIRDEQKFNSLDELKHQIDKDKKTACELLS